MIPSDDPFESWDPERQHGQAILSLRHAGYFAGLGQLGKNNLLINEKFGNMIQIGALLLADRLAPDPLAAYEACPRPARYACKVVRSVLLMEQRSTRKNAGHSPTIYRKKDSF